MDQLGVVGDPMIAHKVSSTFDPRSTSCVEDDDTQMISLEGVKVFHEGEWILWRTVVVFSDWRSDRHSYFAIRTCDRFIR